MAAADAARLPRTEAVTDWLVQPGFTQVVTERHLRNKPLVLAHEERATTPRRSDHPAVA
jgi:hypothetical protein